MLKRFVTYIYQYDRGKRGQNTGFVKADIRDAGCRIQIQLRGQERFQGKGKVYLIVPGEKAVGIPAGELSVRQGLGQLNLAYAKNQLGASGYSVSQIQAVAILCADGKLLASCWSEHVPESVLRGKFDIWGEAADTETAEEGTVPPGADESTAHTTPGTAAGSAAHTDTGAAAISAARTSAGKPADAALPADTAVVSPPSEEPSAQNTDTVLDTISAANPAFHDAAGNRIPEDAPALGIADAPASPDETLIDFGVTVEELQAVTPPPLSASQALTGAADGMTEAADIPPAPSDAPDIPAASGTTTSPFLKAQGDWAQIPHPFSNPSGDAAEGASCPCQNQAPAEQSTQPAAPGAQAEAPEPKFEPPAITYKKIAITDIRTLLPKRNWYLCSNSFLIHGFFNYHYLILKTVEYNGQKKCYLGVPGIYEQPERTMAFMFGFPSFEPARAGEEDSGTASEAADIPPASYGTGVFGYWMLQLMD